MKKLLLCAGLASGLGLGSALLAQSQTFEGSPRPEGPGSASQEQLGGGEGPRGFQRGSGGPGMRGPMGGTGGFGPGGGFSGGPMAQLDPEVRGRLEKEMLLRRQVGEMARKCRDAGAKEKEPLEGELKKALGELIDTEISNHEHRAKKLAEEAARLKESASKARANRDKLIGRRLEQMTEADGWRW